MSHKKGTVPYKIDKYLHWCNADLEYWQQKCLVRVLSRLFHKILKEKHQNLNQKGNQNDHKRNKAITGG